MFHLLLPVQLQRGQNASNDELYIFNIFSPLCIFATAVNKSVCSLEAINLMIYMILF